MRDWLLAVVLAISATALALVLLDQLDRERLPAFALAVAIVGIILLVILLAAGLPAEEFSPA